MAYYIDAHTHILDLSDKENGIYSLHIGTQTKGIHPWDLKSDTDFKIDLTSEVIAIGECGVDRRKSGLVSIEKQVEVFMKHVILCQKHSLPLIVHSVKAHSDVLFVLKKTNYKGLFIIHDFRGNKKEIEQYLNFNSYFSIGLQSVNNLDLLNSIPIEKLFLETDNEENKPRISIVDLYKQAALSLNMDLLELKLQLEKNFLRVFPHLNN